MVLLEIMAPMVTIIGMIVVALDVIVNACNVKLSVNLMFRGVGIY